MNAAGTNDKSIFLASIVNTLKDSVVSIDLQGVITSWNSAAEKLYGYSPEEAIGSSVFMLTLPEEVKKLWANIDKIKSGEQVELYSTIRVNKQGKNMDMEVTLSPVLEHGIVIGVSTIARNITEMKSLQASANLSASRFETITNVVPQIIWENDTHGKATYFNERFIEYSGRSFDDLTGPGWQLIAHPDAHVAVQAWMNALSKKDIFESEALLRRFDGLYQWHLLRNVPLKDGNGEVIGWFGSATNIDDIKSTQLALKDAGERLRITMETAVEFAIITMDKEGYIIDWNSGAEKLFGYSKPEAVGQFADLIFTPEDKYGSMAAQELQTARIQGKAIDERWHIRKDGTRFFMSGVMSRIADHKLAGFVKIARNITDRKLAEEALFLSEQRKSLAVQTAQMGEWEWNIAADRLSCNVQACHLLGRSIVSGDFSGSEFLKVVHENDLPAIRQQLSAARAGEHIFQVECRIVRADNAETRWMNMYGRVIARQHNAALKMIGVLYDITDRKMLEKQKDDFISIASHELKTPLTSVKGYSDLLEDLFTQSGDSANARLVNRLKMQVDRIVKLVHDLLDSNTMVEGRMAFQFETFDMRELIQEQVKELQLVAGKRTLVWAPVETPLVHADRNRIRQVISNFIGNAVKYSPDGTEIIISAKDDLDGLMVTVRDFGIGIPASEQGKIFERYFRSNGPQMAKYAGLGLGLYICAEIIKGHNGSIGANSVLGKGSTFYFKLPYS